MTITIRKEEEEEDTAKVQLMQGQSYFSGLLFGGVLRTDPAIHDRTG